MNILLTNDDGYNSPGINQLKDKLSSTHQVYLCAPLHQMSGTSHSITMGKPMEFEQIDRFSFALDGSPADCVRTAVMGFFPDVTFDLLISGINDSPNMGDDVFYSGTVAGAREGLLHGIFAIACSLDTCEHQLDYTPAVGFLERFIESLDPQILQLKIIFNINIPCRPSFKGVKITHLGKRIYHDTIHFHEKHGKRFVTINGQKPSFKQETNSDLDAVYQDYISITPLTNEFENHSLPDSLIRYTNQIVE